MRGNPACERGERNFTGDRSHSASDNFVPQRWSASTSAVCDLLSAGTVGFYRIINNVSRPCVGSCRCLQEKCVWETVVEWLSGSGESRVCDDFEAKAPMPDTPPSGRLATPVAAQSESSPAFPTTIVPSALSGRRHTVWESGIVCCFHPAQLLRPSLCQLRGCV